MDIVSTFDLVKGLPVMLMSPADHYAYDKDGRAYAKEVTARHLPADHKGTSTDDRLDREIPATGTYGVYLTLRETLDMAHMAYRADLVKVTDNLAVIIFRDLHSAASWARNVPNAFIITPTPLITFTEPVTVHVIF